MRKTRSIAGLSALFLVLGMVVAAPAFAATTCTIGPGDFETLNISVDPAQGARIVRLDSTVEAEDDKIIVTTTSGTTDLCPNGANDFHTVFDIDTINVSGSGAFMIDLTGGDFAPGFNSETGTDEIEFYLASGIALTIQGTDSTDSWSFGQSATTSGPKGVGLNSDSDPDILSGDGTTPATLSVASVTANGGAGHDTFEQISKASEILIGGAGTDTVDYSTRTVAVTVTVGDANTGDGEAAPPESDDVRADVEKVIGGSGNDSISATAAATTGYDFDGGPGNDALTGGAGRDTLFGGATVDTLVGGDDTLLGGAGRDRLNGGVGTDSENGQGGSDVFDQERASNGNDTLIGGTDSDGTDVDIVKYNLRTTSVTVTVGSGANDGATSPSAENDNIDGTVERVDGGSAADTMTAAANGTKLYGNAENDTLTGGDGKDRLVGGGGNDVAIGGAADDYLSGGSGNDRLFGRDGKDNLNGGADDDTMNGEADSDRVSGGSGADELWGDGAATKVKDTLVGGSQPSGKKDTCERDLKDVKSGCEGRAGGTAPTS